MKQLSVLTVVFAVGTAGAQTHVINQSGLNFVDSVSGTNETVIAAGTTVEWQWSFGLHDVTSGTGAADPITGAHFFGPLDAANPAFTHTFNTCGVYPYYCSPHEQFGMTGVIRVMHRVDQVMNTFVDSVSGTNETVVPAGTTVEWQWTFGVHDVTSGASPTAPNAGAQFSGPLTAGNSTFSHTFDTPGLYPYFCTPHFVFGMVGTVRVTHLVTQGSVRFVDSATGSTETLIPTGGTVQWQWTAGIHDVTSGTGAADPNSGALFAAPLTAANPMFAHTFNTPGVYSYYCSPHELFGMVGTVRVGNLLSLSSPAPNAVTIAVDSWAPGTNWRLLVSFFPQNPTGSGVLFGIGGDAWGQIFSPLFQGFIPASGSQSLTIPGIPAGIQVDAVVLGIGAGPALQAVSNVVNFTTQ